MRLKNRGIHVKVDPLLCRNDDRSIAGIEWQAQYFATCLLMPQYILIEKQIGKDLTRWPDLYQIAEELGVSISNLVHRLKDLDWIYIQEGSRKIYLGQTFIADKIGAAG